MVFEYGAWQAFVWDDAAAFYREHWLPMAACLVLYLPCVFAVRPARGARTRHAVRRAFVCWNAGMSAASAYGAACVTPYALRTDPAADRIDRDVPPFALWCVFLFNLSKFWELTETFALRIMGKPVRGVHLIHHQLTAAYAAWATMTYNQAGVHFAALNMSVHSVMYLYFAVAMVAPHWTGPWAATVTRLQFAQMCLGVTIAARGAAAGPACATWCNAAACLLYGVFIALWFPLLWERRRAATKGAGGVAPRPAASHT